MTRPANLPPVQPSAAQAMTTWTATGSNNTAATLTIAGVAGVSHCVTDGIAYCYSSSGTLAGGLLTIKDGTSTVFRLPITAKGQGFIPWRGAASAGNDLVVTMAAGGANVDADVNVCGYAALAGAAPQSAGGYGGAIDFSDPLQSGVSDLEF